MDFKKDAEKGVDIIRLKDEEELVRRGCVEGHARGRGGIVVMSRCIFIVDYLGGDGAGFQKGNGRGLRRTKNSEVRPYNVPDEPRVAGASALGEDVMGWHQEEVETSSNGIKGKEAWWFDADTGCASMETEARWS